MNTHQSGQMTPPEQNQMPESEPKEASNTFGEKEINEHTSVGADNGQSTDQNQEPGPQVENASGRPTAEEQEKHETVGSEPCQTAEVQQEVLEERAEDNVEENEPKMEEVEVWEVVGGQNTGGLLVRVAEDLKSPESIPARLLVGAIVREVERVKTRLHFELA